mmetsp:Transcript_11412/g.14911  ORF Transcript_11412/g.14911 Transcript_11412/m.14911 type:complete len:315 (+) Transcript_11412:2-946(+)
MALEGLERILQVGDEEARQDGVNPYTSMLSATRIEQLESHQSSAIAKRASRIWKQYFVRCALCGAAFGKHGGQTKWCPECKCSVCARCDCTVFHLSYQEELWREVTTQEASQKASKKSKKQKKKKKLKERRAAKQQQQKSESPVNKASSKKIPVSASEECAQTSQQELDTEERSPSMTIKRKARLKPGMQNGSRTTTNENGRADNQTTQINSHKDISSREKGGNKTKRTEKADLKKKNGMNAQTCYDAMKRHEGQDNGVPTPLQGNISSEGENDDLVSFLQQTGSILALAELMDQEEGDNGVDSVVDNVNLVKT